MSQRFERHFDHDNEHDDEASTGIDPDLLELDRRIGAAMCCEPVPPGLTERLFFASAGLLRAPVHADELDEEREDLDARRLLLHDSSLDPEYAGESMLPRRSFSGRIAILAMAAAVLMAIGLTLRFSPQLTPPPPPPGRGPAGANDMLATADEALETVNRELGRLDRRLQMSELAESDAFRAEFAVEAAAVEKGLESVELALLTSPEEWAMDAAIDYGPAMRSLSESVGTF